MFIKPTSPGSHSNCVASSCHLTFPQKPPIVFLSPGVITEEFSLWDHKISSLQNKTVGRWWQKDESKSQFPVQELERLGLLLYKGYSFLTMLTEGEMKFSGKDIETDSEELVSVRDCLGLTPSIFQTYFKTVFFKLQIPIPCRTTKSIYSWSDQSIFSINGMEWNVCIRLHCT